MDIYALGLIFVELLLAFCTEMERRNVLKDLKSLNFPKNFDVDFFEEVSTLLFFLLFLHDLYFIGILLFFCKRLVCVSKMSFVTRSR